MSEETLSAALIAILGAIVAALWLMGCGAPAIERVSTPAMQYALAQEGCSPDIRIYAYDPALLQETCHSSEPVYGCAYPTFIKIAAGLSEEYNCQVVAHECLHIRIHAETGDWDYGHTDSRFLAIPELCRIWQ